MSLNAQLSWSGLPTHCPTQPTLHDPQAHAGAYSVIGSLPDATHPCWCGSIAHTRTAHALVRSHCSVEGAVPEEPEEGPESAQSRSECSRALYERAYKNLRENTPDAKEEAVMLLEGWKAFEQEQTWRCDTQL